MGSETSDGPDEGVRHRLGLLSGRLIFGAGRRLMAVLPMGAVRALENRLFYSVFQVTRVTNDAYGWRPDTPGGGTPPPSAKMAQERSDGD
jgi:hypothetical protein